MSSLFSLPLPTYQQPLIKSKRCKAQPKKRKRQGQINQDSQTSIPDDNDDDEDLHYLPELQPQASSQSLEYSAVLTPDERTQYRIAGQPFDQIPPVFPFPHAALKNDDQPSPWTDSRTKRLAPTLHLQHLATITAILHRCLAEHDYSRASRAFGLILRDTVGGRAIDIRIDGRWGIGAEILLKAGSQQDRPLERRSADEALSRSGPLFTREGFERAKQYYERLIVQFPFTKTHAGAVNALDFYQALFGLWIYIVHEEGKGEVDSEPELRGQIQLRELEQAREIASRMDACMSSIPFMDDLELIRLRGMVGLWMADLAESCAGRMTPQSQGVDTGGVLGTDIAFDSSQTVVQDGGGSAEALWLDGAQYRRIAQHMFSRLPR